MAEQFYTILTSIGKAKIANATALGNKVNLVKFQVGDGGGNYYNPTEEQTKLRNKVWEGNINNIRVDEDNPNWIVLETIIPGDIGGFMIREAGVFDNEDNLIAIGKYPETYKPVVADGSTKDLIIKMILEVSNTSSVTLKVDPTVILATQKDIEVLNNKIENIEVPVTSVNGQTGKVALTARDIPGLNNFNVEQILLYMQEQLVILGKKQGKLSTLKTTNKNNIVGALNELFTNANNGKKLISDVVGSPLLATDSFKQQKDKIQGLKNSFASNLTGKGQNSNSTENLGNLINKVKNISTGKKFAKGNLTANSKGDFSVSGLSFTPKNIIFYAQGNPSENTYFTFGYSDDILRQSRYQAKVMGCYNTSWDKYKDSNISSVSLYTNGFKIYADSKYIMLQNSSINWIAIS